MKYIICDECEGFYELEKGESLEDFESCLCGGSLSYAELTPRGMKKITETVQIIMKQPVFIKTVLKKPVLTFLKIYVHCVGR
ncbi:hypothetical protein [Methanobacterium formicicum]|uniref:Uncharacterized protein n=1 Tax=Methanobacterium formicicum (strain DSM 3637 / PP1) TaxID=1204725 RepID=K2R114_METFP|nr:hypothetical protein [Methanobacterium formicicum]EKF84862.1 hypothetical protein A994_11727 [Methanobacterium formicicum DSM 3637]